MSTPIAEMVVKMIAAGVAPDMIALAVSTAEMCVAVTKNPPTSADQSVDPATAKRRKYDRDRQAEIRRLRGLSADNPPTSETPLTYLLPSSEIIESKKEEKKVRARKAPSAPLSAEWQIKPTHFEAAEKLHIPRSAVLSKSEDMRIWAKSSGALKADWDATFHGFLRRDADKLSGQNNGKRTVQQAAADLLDRVRAFDEPAPSELRDGAGEIDVRLLPSR